MTRLTLAYQRAYTMGLARGASHPEEDPADDMTLGGQVLAQVGSTHGDECECESCEAVLSAYHYAWSTAAWGDDERGGLTDYQWARSETMQLLHRVLAAHEPITLWRCSCGRNGKGTITNAVEHRADMLFDALAGRVIPALKA